MIAGHAVRFDRTVKHEVMFGHLDDVGLGEE